jgi:hypothetical protein
MAVDPGVLPENHIRASSRSRRFRKVRFVHIDGVPSRQMIANIALDDGLILPHGANPTGSNFRERQARERPAAAMYNARPVPPSDGTRRPIGFESAPKFGPSREG